METTLFLAAEWSRVQYHWMLNLVARNLTRKCSSSFINWHGKLRGCCQAINRGMQPALWSGLQWLPTVSATPTVWVCSGCHDSIPQAEHTTETEFLTVLGTGSSRSKCQPDQCLERALSLIVLQMVAFSLYILIWPFLAVCVQAWERGSKRERGRKGNRFLFLKGHQFYRIRAPRSWPHLT